MARLFRPTVPVEVKCRVALRQLGEMWPDKAIDARRHVPSNRLPPRGGLGAYLGELLERLADLLGCAVADLRLDHDPPLALRPQERCGLGGRKVYYVPDANDPEHLKYRPHGTQFAGSHDVKTRIRGEHGQFSDIVLIKRQRRRNRHEQQVKTGLKPGFKAKKKMKSRSAWPPKGSRKIPTRSPLRG